MARLRIVTLGFVAFLVAACGPSGAGSSPTTGAASQAAASQAAVVTAAPTPDACAKENLKTMTAGKLTISADNPAFPPFYIPDDPKPAGSEWELGQPTNGKGLESATAYAIADMLGFSKEEVVWIASPGFNTVIQPGKKAFDMYLTQVSYSDERAEAVDLSDGYFNLNQAVVALASNDASKVTSLAGLKALKLGAQVGTTSFKYIVDNIQPTKDPAIYDTNDAAITALKAHQIDAIVADLPSAFYMRDAQLSEVAGGGKIVGSLPTAAGEDVEHFSVLLNKGSSLTACVNAAIRSLKEDGTLDTITQQWISNAGAPELQ